MVVLPIKLSHCQQTPWLRFDLFGVSNPLVNTWAGLKKEVLIGSFECSVSELLLHGDVMGRITANGGTLTARVMGVVEGHREDHPGTLQKCYCLDSALSACQGDLFVVETLWESLYTTIVPLQILPHIIADRTKTLQNAKDNVQEFERAAARRIETQVFLHTPVTKSRKQMSLKEVCSDPRRHPLISAGDHPDSDGPLTNNINAITTKKSSSGAVPFHSALFTNYDSIAGALQTATEYEEKHQMLQERVAVREAVLKEVGIGGYCEWA